MKVVTNRDEPENDDEREVKFVEHVNRAKNILANMADERLKIAELAFKVCDTDWDFHTRAYGSKYESTYTLTRFAKEIGVHYKTLIGWCRTKRNVYDKILPLVKINPREDWAALSRTSEKCKKNETPEQVLKKFKAWDKVKLKKFNEDRHLLTENRRIKSFVFYLENRADPRKLDKEQFDELVINCRKIIKWAKENEDELKD